MLRSYIVRTATEITNRSKSHVLLSCIKCLETGIICRPSAHILHASTFICLSRHLVQFRNQSKVKVNVSIVVIWAFNSPFTTGEKHAHRLTRRYTGGFKLKYPTRKSRCLGSLTSLIIFLHQIFLVHFAHNTSMFDFR